MFCPNCGNKINDENKFCPNCGFEINTHNKNENGYDTKIISSDSFSSNDKADNIFKRLVCAYISRDASGRIESNATNHYYSVFSKLDLNPNSFTWNWGAFFFGPLNFFYRKAFLAGIIFIAVTFIVGSIGVNMGFDVSGVLFWCAAATFGDRIHFSRFKQKLKEAKLSYPDDISKQCEYLSRN